MAESKAAGEGDAPLCHRPTLKQCEWIKKGTKALGTLHLGGRITAKLQSPPAVGLKVTGQDAQFVRNHFHGMFLQPGDELREEADPAYCRIGGIVDTLMFAPSLFYPHLFRPPAPTCGCSWKWVRGDGWTIKMNSRGGGYKSGVYSLPSCLRARQGCSGGFSRW